MPANLALMQKVTLLISLLVLTLISCSEKSETVETVEDAPMTIELDDNFDADLKSFWEFDAADSTRFSITKNPLQPDLNVLSVNLKMNDVSSAGKRSELVIYTKDSIGFKTNYSFKFMLPEDFFKQDDVPGMILIHQWHDKPDSGYTWATQQKDTRPPLYLYIERTQEGEYFLIFRAGLQSGTLNEVVGAKWPEQMEPNYWYTFSCEVLWHMYNNKAYALPKLDDVYMYTNTQKVVNDSIAIDSLSTVDNVENHKIYRRNMYNANGNYFKLGLYRFAEKYEKTIYFDDFKYESVDASSCD